MLSGIGITLLYVFQHQGIMFVKSTSFLGDMNPNWFFGIVIMAKIGATIIDVMTCLFLKNILTP
jgi:hypothetical protein